MPANYLTSFGGYQSVRWVCKLTGEFVIRTPGCIIERDVENPQQSSTQFTNPAAIDRFFNRVFGFLIRLGVGLSHNYLLEVRGRKTGRIYSTPVNLLEHGGKNYLVAPRGYTQWVRNVVASGEASLVRGLRREEVFLRPVPDEAKPDILNDYLDRYSKTVQRYFPIQAGSPVEAFHPLASIYPVFEVISKH
jgi:deazaflavin-dependent oxidoreductase (nitroreductase family)